MSYRKTKLIQERNILLEKKYILEQGPVPPPAPPPAPVPIPPSTGTPPPSSGETKPFEIKSVEDFKTPENKNKLCSKMKIPTEIISQKKEIEGYQYYLTKDNSQLFCYDEIEDKK